MASSDRKPRHTLDLGDVKRHVFLGDQTTSKFSAVVAVQAQ
jgi:hypothetical protein